MMKKLTKLTKLALLAAATAFLLAGFPACSSDDDDDPTLTGIKITVDASKVKTTYVVNEAFTSTGITVTATYSDGSTKDVTNATEFKATYQGNAFTTATEGTYENVILTATYEGETDSTTCTIKVEASSTDDPKPKDPTPTPDSKVTAVWDFNAASLIAVGLNADAKTTTANPTTDNITAKSGSGATLKFKINATNGKLGKSVKIQNAESGGLNIGTGNNESDILLITVDDACTLTFTGKGSSGESSWTSSSINSFSVAGTSVYERKTADETKSQTWTYQCDKAGEYTIKACGMIFTELKCE